MPGRRTARRVGLYSALAACFFTTQHCHSFVHHAAMMSRGGANRQKPQTNTNHPSAISRANLLSSAAVVGAAFFWPVRSEAALPTAEDYAFGTGSKKQRATTATDDCPDCSLSERRKRAAASAEAAAVPSSPGQVKRPETQDELSVPLPKSSINPDDPVEVLRGVSAELDRMQALVNKERWGDALTRLRSFPLTTLKSPTLGMGSVGDVGRALGVTNSKASDILEASLEAGLTLREVEDIVFSNTRTLEFFNSADYKQVEDLAKNRKPTDLTEPLQLISDTKKLVDGVTEMMGAGPASLR